MVAIRTSDPDDVKQQDKIASFLGEVEHLSDKVVVHGGDGTLLKSIRELGLDKVFVPMNGGHLGFLMNPDSNEAWNRIANGEYKVHEFNLLSVEARIRDSNHFISGIAVNDVYVERDSGQTARLDLEVNEQPLMPKGTYLGADGIIVSTSLGSTAYSFSAGGQVSHPLVPLINLTPICPHLPKIPPMTLSVDSCITIRPMEPKKRPVRLVIDGVTYRNDFDRIEVCRHDERLRIAYLNDMDFTQRLVKKIIQRS